MLLLVLNRKIFLLSHCKALDESIGRWGRADSGMRKRGAALWKWTRYCFSPEVASEKQAINSSEILVLLWELQLIVNQWDPCWSVEGHLIDRQDTHQNMETGSLCKRCEVLVFYQENSKEAVKSLQEGVTGLLLSTSCFWPDQRCQFPFLWVPSFMIRKQGDSNSNHLSLQLTMI